MPCLVVANGEPPSPQLLSKLAACHDLLVATDGGLYAYLNAGITPHLLIGDFDSVSHETRAAYRSMTQIETPDQNHSDLEKTIDYLFQQGTEQITVCGALGQRLDHTLTNICILCRYPDRVKFWSDSQVCFALKNKSHVDCNKGQKVSLLPMSTEVTAVYTHGLQWELTGQTLTKYFVSISNVCLHNHIEISFEKGDLIFCMNS